MNVTPFFKYKVGCVTPSSEYLLPLGVETTVRDCKMVEDTTGSVLMKRRFPSPLISNKDVNGVTDTVSVIVLL